MRTLRRTLARIRRVHVDDCWCIPRKYRKMM